jgi:hypothetical protein
MARQHGGEEDALREVTREVRVEPPAELDWQELERSLMRRVAATPAAKITPISSRGFPLLVAAAALAAVVAIGFTVSLTRDAGRSAAPVAEAPTPRTFGPELTGPLDGARLAAGDRVRAGFAPVTVEHRDHATWILSPGSSATLLTVGSVLTIRLDSGAVSAEIIPVHRPESFAVEVGSTRVAAHGTRFRVERRNQRVFVDVSEGVIAVRPIGASKAGAQGWVLQAPSSGDFALDGRSGQVFAAEAASRPKPASRSRRPFQHRSPAHGHSAPAGSASSIDGMEQSMLDVPDAGVLASRAETPAAAPVDLPAKPTLGDVEAGVSRVIDAMGACFSEHIPPRGDMRVTARTALKLEIDPEGRIAAEEFEPPLAPGVTECARARSESIRFAPSREGISLNRIVELSR